MALEPQELDAVAMARAASTREEMYEISKIKLAKMDVTVEDRLLQIILEDLYRRGYSDGYVERNSED